MAHSFVTSGGRARHASPYERCGCQTMRKWQMCNIVDYVRPHCGWWRRRCRFGGNPRRNSKWPPSRPARLGGAAPEGGGPKGGRGAGGTSSPIRLDLPCLPLRFFIQLAYIIPPGGLNSGAQNATLEGGPAWIDSERYQIDANADGPTSKDAMNGPMLRALLEERFQLKTHRETRQVPVYALTVAKGGLKIHPANGGSCAPRDLTQPSLVPPPGQKPWCG